MCIYSGIPKWDLERRGNEIAIFSYQRGEKIIVYCHCLFHWLPLMFRSARTSWNTFIRPIRINSQTFLKQFALVSCGSSKISNERPGYKMDSFAKTFDLHGWPVVLAERAQVPNSAIFPPFDLNTQCQLTFKLEHLICGPNLVPS